jgi:hypothetical protein
MTHIELAPAMPGAASGPEDGAPAGCPACTHPVEVHDTTATRFCAATTARALARGCVCRP